MIKEIAVKILNTNNVEFFEVNLKNLEEANKFIKKKYNGKNVHYISKPYPSYPNGDEVVYTVEYC